MAPYGSNGVNLYLYLGAPSGVGLASSYLVPGGASFAASVACPGDINGDGFGDVVVGSGSAVYVYFGAASGSLTGPTIVTAPDASQDGGFGAQLASPGDLDADGFCDLVVSVPFFHDTGRVYIFRGSASGLSTLSPTSLFLPNLPTGMFGGSLASATRSSKVIEARGDRACRL